METQIDGMKERLATHRARIEVLARQSRIAELRDGELYQRVCEKLLRKANKRYFSCGHFDGTVVLTARNILQDQARKKKAVADGEVVLSQKVSPACERPDRKCLRNELRRIVRDVVHDFPKRDRALLWKRFSSSGWRSRPLSGAERCRLFRILSIMRNEPRLKPFQCE